MYLVSDFFHRPGISQVYELNGNIPGKYLVYSIYPGFSISGDPTSFQMDINHNVSHNVMSDLQCWFSVRALRFGCKIALSDANGVLSSSL